MASLSFKQRQLLQETRDELLVSEEAVRKMTTEQRLQYESQALQRSMQHLSEFQRLTSSATISSRPAISSPATTIMALSDLNGLNQQRTGVEETEEEDEDDLQYALARFLTPPGFAEDNKCHKCTQPFTVTLFRHHCRHCGHSFCHEHSLSRRQIHRFGLVHPVRVCDACALVLDELSRVDQLVWRDSRVRAWLQQRLIPYTFTAIYGDQDIDRGVDKAYRVADYSLSVARNTLILNFPTKVALETIEVLKRYGLTGFAGLLLTREFMEAIETLKQLVRVEDMFSLSLHELTACVYYKLAIDRGLRGCQPDLPLETHKDTNFQRRLLQQLHEGDEEEANRKQDEVSYSCRVASEFELRTALEYAPIALEVVYESSELDMRRLARHHDLELLCSNVDASEISSRPDRPVYALFVPSQSSSRSSCAEALVAIRGTQSIQDVVTDIRAAPHRFPPSADKLLALMRGVAVPLDDDDDAATNGTNRGHMTQENGSGSNIGRTAASGCADSKSGSEGGVTDLGEEYSCEGMARAAWYVLGELGPSLLRLVEAGVRVRVLGHSLGGAVAALLVLCLRRALRELRYEDAHQSSSCRSRREGDLQREAEQVRGVAFSSPSCFSAALSDELLVSNAFLSVVLRDDVITRVTPQSTRQLLRELLVFRTTVFRHLQQDWSDVIVRARDLWAPRQPKHQPSSHAHQTSSSASTVDFRSVLSLEGKDIMPLLEDGEEEVVRQELELWQGGQVLHVYPWRGQWHASVVSRSFPPLRRIEVLGHIFEDHRSHNVFNALVETLHVHRLRERTGTSGGASSGRCVPPLWTPFDCADKCACCSLQFTWHSTFRGAAQEFRERYHCRSCGGLVCGPCSKARRPIPRLGMLQARRICDRCLQTGAFAG